MPPHHSEVPSLMKELDKDLQEKLLNLKKVSPPLAEDIDEEELQDIESILYVAAWIQHRLTWIHPFVEGNGRTARFITNLVLERYGLVAISIKVQKNNKDRYLNALRQIDNHNDYEPLVDLITEGIIARYEGLDNKFI